MTSQDDTPTHGGDDDATSSGFFEDATAAPDGAGAPPATPSGFSFSAGDAIGRYTIRQLLGEGGMGAVYLADQSEPVKRTVALKVIKPGMDSAEVIARFEAERQAVAVMDHPCIARVYDGGTTERGLPYFVMEHVKGLPITEHCDRHKLDMDARLRLFMRACEAVQHAHGKGVIHRDLKPGNILVSYQGDDHTPKVIDFGIAKALGGKLTEATMHTELGAFVGTPEYMSPEQAGSADQDVDTRADVYALGVILYELLTGARPFDAETLKKAALFEIQRIIREVDPPRPSTRLDGLSTGGTGTRIAENRRTEVRSLSGALKRDLDWVVMKCLEKDRARRYDTANALAMEIQRYLGDEPVLAGPPTASYRLSKFVTRNRAGVIAAGVGVMLVLAGLAGTSAGLIEARRQAEFARLAAESETEQRGLAVERADEAEAARARAETAEADASARAEELQLVADFQAEQLGDIEVEAMGAGIRDSILDGAPDDQREGLAGALSSVNFTNIAMGTLEESIFEKTLAAIDEQFADQPLVRAQLLQSVASTLRVLGLLELALDPQTRALAIRRDTLGDDHQNTLTSFTSMGALIQDRGEFVEAERYWREAIDIYRRVFGDDHPYTLNSLNNMGHALYSQVKYEQAEPYYRESLDGRRRVLGDDHPDTLASIASMAGLRWAHGDYEKARSLYHESLDGRRRVLSNDHPDTLYTMQLLGQLLQAQGKLDEAEPYFRETLEGRRRLLGDKHQQTLYSILSMGAFLHARLKLDEAEECFREALEGFGRVLGDDHIYTLSSLNYMGHVLMAQGKLDEAEPYFRETLERRRRVLGDDHPETMYSILTMGSLMHARLKLDEAEACFREALEGFRRVLRDDHTYTLSSLNSMGLILQDKGQLDEAEPYFRETLERRRLVLGDDHPQVVVSLNNMASLLNAMGRHAEGEPVVRESLERSTRVLGQDHWRVAESRSLLGGSIAGQARYKEAEPLLLESYASLDASLPDGLREKKLPSAVARLVKLYEAWHAAEPGTGHDASAVSWRANLPADFGE